jgi:tRNA (cytidine/uridine-2'-O-)-methyltransferase
MVVSKLHAIESEYKRPEERLRLEMLEVVLYQPEIPPNTGNILRLCANTGARLHLVKPLGFHLNDRRLMRAGLDYGTLAQVTVHGTWAACRAHLRDRRWFALTTRGVVRYDTVAFQRGNVVVFGPESRGLPEEVLAEFTPEARLRIPMEQGSRSLNLANAVAVVVYEAWRQAGFTENEKL